LDIQNFQELDELALMLKHNHQVHIEIGVHTDNTVEPTFAKTLSQKRAEAISKYLQKHGAKKYQIVVHGYGNTKSLIKNDDEMNNNRVEIMMLKNE
jgi:OmpA-OmpF porin, OOP family